MNLRKAGNLRIEGLGSLALFVSLVISLLIAGCGSSSSHTAGQAFTAQAPVRPSTSTIPAGPTSPAACSLLTPAEVGTSTGLTVTTSGPSPSSASDCRYPISSSGSSTTSSVTLSAATSGDAQDIFDTPTANETQVGFPGVSNAYWDPTGKMLHAVAANTLVNIMVILPGGATKPPQDAAIDMLHTLEPRLEGAKLPVYDGPPGMDMQMDMH